MNAVVTTEKTSSKTSNMPSSEANSEQKEKVVGRNEACPCGSGKKYKRCCGVGAAPKITPPKQSSANSSLEGEGGAGPGGPFDPSMLQNFNPEMMMQVTQTLQKLPKGQLQRLQAIMQKAMRGKDVSVEAEEFQRTLPLELQNLMQTMSMMPGMAGLSGQDSQNGMASSAAEQDSTSSEQASASESTPSMTEEEARALVAKAAAEGKIGKEEAEALLKNDGGNPPFTDTGVSENSAQASDSQKNDSESKLSRFWKNFSGKKTS